MFKRFVYLIVNFVLVGLVIPSTTQGAKDPVPADGAEDISTAPVISTFISSDVPKYIPDWNWTTQKNIPGEVMSTLEVFDSINIKDLNVELDITMPGGSNGDLNVYLTSPDGKKVKLFDDIGVHTSNFTNTILDDEAASAITSAKGPYRGIYKPEGKLSDFDNRDSQGTWELEIIDDWPGGPGILNSWRIVIENPVTVSWTPGEGFSQNVYFSENYDDVNGVDDIGLLANLPADASSVEVGDLALDTTYYWRVDEVGEDGVVLNMGDVWSFSTPLGNVSIDKRIASGADDAEEDLNPEKLGEVDQTSSDLEMPYEDTGMGDPQIMGLRFVDIDLHPDMLILESSVQFEVDEIKDGVLPVNLIIEGELNPDPNTFAEGGPGIFDISSRPRTEAMVPWSVPVWDTVDAQGPDQMTSDLTLVIEEIIAQPDWAAGNAMVLIFSDDPCNPSEGNRCAESYNGEESAAPMLHISAVTEAANNPSPADGAVNVAQDVILNWSPGFTGVSREVYFGTENPPQKLEETTGTTYDVGTLEKSMTYYWKIDEIDADGTKHPGAVWSFTTVKPLNLLDLAVELNTEGEFAGAFDTLIAAVLAADPLVADALAGEDELTVFAPTDDAFAALALTPENIGQLGQSFLTDVLLYHVTSGRLLAADVLAAQQIEMLKGGVLMQDGGVLTDNLGGKATIIVTDVEASNGVIHAIDAVVLPKAPPEPQPNLLDLAIQLNTEGEFAGAFDTLIAAVLAADPLVADALAGKDELTVFAPTDDAFAALELTPENIGDLDQAFLTDVLLYHVTAGRLLAADVLAAEQIEMLKGGVLMQDGGVLTDNLGGKATIIVTDVEASNGVIHAIDAVVLPKAPPEPQPNLLDLAIQLNTEGEFAGAFDTLIAAVLAADPLVANALAGEDELTVFAPTDEAFAALEFTPENIGDLDQAFLTDVLLYHVTAGRLLAADVLAAKQIEMLKGGVLMQDGGVLTDNLGGKATIIVTDVEASNGVIHAIDAVVLPKAP